MSYYELWAILASWRREFSIAEFALTFASPDPRKVLHDMVGKGLLEHPKRGRYSVRSIGDYVKMKNDVNAGYDLLNEAGMPYALTGLDGVFAWTGGAYNAGRFFGFYPIHLKVRSRDVPFWRRFLTAAGKRVFTTERRPRETIFGVFYILHAAMSVEAETVNGVKVEPLRETLEFCRKNIYTFEPALNMLTENHRVSPRASA